MELKDLQSEVDRYLPTGSDRSQKLAGNLREIVDRAASTRRYAVEALLSSYRHRAYRTPPYEKRLNGTELRWAVIKTNYRPTPPADRIAQGVGGLARKRMAQSHEREAAGYLAHTHKFALDIAEKNLDELATLDPDLAAALARCER